MVAKGPIRNRRAIYWRLDLHAWIATMAWFAPDCHAVIGRKTRLPVE
jgi:hypothetical protein